MTVVPIPVAPTPVESASAVDTAADTKAAPGFANLLDAAQGQDANESTDSVAGDATSGGDSGDGGEKPANALSDATVAALLAALTGVAPQPVTPEPVVVDVTATSVEAEVVTAEAEVAATTISLVADEAETAAAAEPVVVAPAPLTDDAGEPAPTTDAAAPEPAPPTPAPTPTAARPDAAIVAPVAVDADATTPPVAVAPTAPATDTDKPAPPSATAFTVATPPAVAPTEARGATPVAPTAPAAAPAHPVPAEQVVSVLRPLRRAADGTYELRLQLRPPELGQIELRVELRHGVLHAALQADNPQAVEIIRNGLAELRSRLEAEGVRAGALTVDSNAAQMSQRDRESQRETRDSSDPLAVPIETIAAAAQPATDTDALLDVRI